MTGKGMPLVVRGDLNGFWALFADNLANMVIIGGVCKFVFQMPDEIVFGRILPGVGLALLFGLAFYAWQARRLSRREGRSDVTALPYGISTPILFVYLFGVIGPIYWISSDATLAWQVGVGAAFLGGILEALGALVGPLLKRVTPRAGMLGTLAGIAIVWIAGVPMAEIFEHAAIGFPALAIVLIGLVAGVRLPFGLPAGLVAIVVGTAVGLATGSATFSAEGTGFYLPVPVLGDLWAGVLHIFHNPVVLMVVLPIEVYNFIETMNNVESAEAAGDRYDVRVCQLMDGAGTVVGAVFGSPFPTTVYIGHPAYKRLGARAGYALLVGLVFFVGNLFGLVAFLHHLIPMAAVAPILVFVGIIICGQAFRASPGRHAIAVSIALVPHVGDILTKKMTGLAGYFSSLQPPEGSSLHSAIEAVKSGVVPDEIAAKLLDTQGVHIIGQSMLSRGAIITGLLWGAMAALLIDRRFGAAAAFAVAGLVLALFGFIHAAVPGFHYDSPAVWGYGLMALFFLVTGLTAKETPVTEGEEGSHG